MLNYGAIDLPTRNRRVPLLAVFINNNIFVEPMYGGSTIFNNNLASTSAKVGCSSGFTLISVLYLKYLYVCTNVDICLGMQKGGPFFCTVLYSAGDLVFLISKKEKARFLYKFDFSWIVFWLVRRVHLYSLVSIVSGASIKAHFLSLWVDLNIDIYQLCSTCLCFKVSHLG